MSKPQTQKQVLAAMAKDLNVRTASVTDFRLASEGKVYAYLKATQPDLPVLERKALIAQFMEYQDKRFQKVKAAILNQKATSGRSYLLSGRLGFSIADKNQAKIEKAKAERKAKARAKAAAKKAERLAAKA